MRWFHQGTSRPSQPSLVPCSRPSQLSLTAVPHSHPSSLRAVSRSRPSQLSLTAVPHSCLSQPSITVHSFHAAPRVALTFDQQAFIRVVVSAEMADEDSIASAVGTVSEKVGAAGLNLLINNAAITKSTLPGPLSDTIRQDMMDVYETNVAGTFLLTKAGVSDCLF